jgi:hypothetical protein
MEPMTLSPDRSIALGSLRVRIVDVPRLFAEEPEPPPARLAQTMWLRLAAALRRRIAAQGSSAGRPQLRGILIEPRNVAASAQIG